MERRAFLARGAVVLGVVAASGCTEQRLVEAEREPPPLEGASAEAVDLPAERRLAVAAAGIERASDEEFADLEAFETYLADADVDVEELTEEESAGERILALESAFEPSAEAGLMHHLGVVAGGYAALVAGGHGGERLETSLLDAGSRPYGEYEIRRQWATEYDEGTLTARQYAHEIAVTAESV